jgi:hypothetical protein
VKPYLPHFEDKVRDDQNVVKVFEGSHVVFHVFNIGEGSQMEDEVHERCGEGDQALIPANFQVQLLRTMVWRNNPRSFIITSEKPIERGSWR